MPEIARTAQDMIARMSPELRPGAYVFVSTRDGDLVNLLAGDAIATFHEAEGLSMLVPVALAGRHGLDCELPMRCITLNVYSALDGVGLTAAVASALAGAGIPCNMIAAHHHDHVFVPETQCEAAMQVLEELQDRAAGP